jgi:hypothetical protein
MLKSLARSEAQADAGDTEALDAVLKRARAVAQRMNTARAMPAPETASKA